MASPTHGSESRWALSDEDLEVLREEKIRELMRKLEEEQDAAPNDD